MKDRCLDIDPNAPRMTFEEFAHYWLDQDENGYSALSCFEEGLSEAATQYHSECALFGDAGPGQAYHLARGRAELARIRAVLARQPISTLSR